MEEKNKTKNKSFIGHCKNCGANFLYKDKKVKDGFLNCPWCSGLVEHKLSDELKNG